MAELSVLILNCVLIGSALNLALPIMATVLSAMAVGLALAKCDYVVWTARFDGVVITVAALLIYAIGIMVFVVILHCARQLLVMTVRLIFVVWICCLVNILVLSVVPAMPVRCPGPATSVALLATAVLTN